MSVTSEFRKFALRGNLLDMAIGFTVGAAFTATARSLVDDLIMPPIGLLLGRSDFSDLYLLLAPGEAAPPPYATAAEAQAAGAVTLDYGAFINTAIGFLLVALVMFMIIKAINRIDRQLEREAGAAETAPSEPDEKKCPYCLSTVPAKATRCPLCTSHLPGLQAPGAPPPGGPEGPSASAGAEPPPLPGPTA